MITSVNNPQVKEVKLLQKKAKARNEKEVYIVEGLRMFEEAERDDMVKVYVSFPFYEKHREYFDEKCRERFRETPIEIVEEKVFGSMCDTQTPQGVLSILKQKRWSLEALLMQERPLFLIIENLQDPGNLGTMMRTGEGAGVTGCILSKACVDMYNPKTVRATMGSIYRVPFVYTENLAQSVALLKKQKIQVLAAHLQGRRPYDAFDYRTGTAFLIGNEGNGLTEETAALADEYLRIPMRGRVESLNASAAASILMYEAARQRGFQS